MGRRKFLSAIVPYAKPVGSRESYIRLDLNENRRRPAPGVVRAIRRLPAAELAMYPEKELLQQQVANFHGLNPENVLLANGADEAIRWVFEALVDVGDTVVWAAPTFSIYELTARLRQARIQAITFNNDLSFPLAGILQALVEKPNLLVLVSPNNPTGTVISDEELRQILTQADETLVLLDEAYGFFAGLDHAAWIKEFPNLIILNSFSKAFALAGLRLGYLLARTGLLQHVEKIAPPYAVNAAASNAGMAALADIGYARRQADAMHSEQRFLLKSLLRLDIPCRGTAANFILARFTNVAWVWEKLRRHGILCKNLDHEPCLAGCLRITVGNRIDNRCLLRTLAQILPVQAVLFDMDGVLVDVSKSYDQTVLQTVANFCGQKPDISDLQNLRLNAGFNNDWQAAAALLKAHHCQVDLNEIVARFQQIYLGLNHDGLCRHEKWLLAESVLKKLASRFTLGIVTGRPRAEAQWVLNRFGFNRYFRVLVCAEDTAEKPKPHPGGIRLALRRLGVRRAVYVGDRVDDMLAAKAAGIRTVAVCPGAGSHADAVRLRLEQAGADQIIKDSNNIMEVLDETSRDQA